MDIISTSLKPTLFIALGGTGKRVALGVRRRLLENKWGNVSNPFRLANVSDFPLAQFIYFDFDWPDYFRSDLFANPIIFTDEERICSLFDLKKYICSDEYLKEYPHIASWFPLNNVKGRLFGFCSGRNLSPQVLRPISRLYFYDQYTKIRDSITQKLNHLRANASNRHQLERLSLSIDGIKVRVVVIGSVAGGTGYQ